MEFQLKSGRVEAFSDGVFAIIVTLLVLELKVPHLHDALSNHEAFEALVELYPKFLSFILSFIYVVIFWVNHHHFFHLITHVNRGLVWLNNMLLLCLSFIPFPTAFIGDYPNNSVGLAFFAFILTLSGIVFNLMWRHAYKKGLFNELVTPQYFAKAARVGFVGPLCYVVAGMLAFVLPVIAWCIFIFIPIYYSLPNKPRG